jgi:hydrogenase-4 component B
VTRGARTCEGPTVAFYGLVSFDGSDRNHPRAPYPTLVVGRIGGAFLLLGFLMLAGKPGGFELSAWSGVPNGAFRSLAYALIVAGFAAKIGIVPLQVWMPAGCPAAPGTSPSRDVGASR